MMGLCPLASLCAEFLSCNTSHMFVGFIVTTFSFAGLCAVISSCAAVGTEQSGIR